MAKKTASNLMQLSKAMATMARGATALCHATEDEFSNVSADYLDGMLALAREMSVHTDIMYDVVIDGRNDIDETTKNIHQSRQG